MQGLLNLLQLVNKSPFERTRDTILYILNKMRLSKEDLVRLWGTIGYDIGRSIYGKDLEIEELEKLYYTEPSLGIAMMCQSLHVISWVEKDGKESRKDSRDNKTTAIAPNLLS